MRSEVRKLRAHKRRLQWAIVAGAAIVTALAVLIADALMSNF